MSSWDQLEHMLSKFNFSFNWEYCGNCELRLLLNDVFRILKGDDERTLEQILIGCVHQACPGLTLNQPRSNPGLPYELKFVVHPSEEDFCITKVVILSEARHLELYVNDSYEKTLRGVMLTMNKGRKLSLFEAEIDLSSYTSTVSNATIKFLSLPCKNKMKLQAVVMKVEKCQPIFSTLDHEKSGLEVDLESVKRLLDSVGIPLSNGAQKMLESVERYQKSPLFKAHQLLSSQNAARLRKEVPNCAEALVPNKKLQVVDEKDEKRHRISSPEEDRPFMNMLADLCLKRSDGDGRKTPETDLTESSPQSRWAAYLQSRVRASQKMSSSESASLLGAFRSMSLEGFLETPEDDLGTKAKSRQRPYSVGCVDCGEVDRTIGSEILQKEWLHKGQHSKCKACGCPGCLDVHNAVTANILAAEERIMEKVDNKFAQLQEDISQKFASLVQLLSKRQEIEERTGDEEVSSTSMT